MGKVGQIFRKGLAENIKQEISGKKGTFLISYSSLNAAQMDSLRKKLKDLNVQVYVSKNRIAQLVLKDLAQEQLAGKVEHQTAFAWTDHDAAAVSKALVDFAKDNENIHIQGGLIEGAFLQKADVQRLADLPSKEILQAQLLAMIVSPLTRLAGALNAKTRDLLSILKQLSEKKGGS